MTQRTIQSLRDSEKDIYFNIIIVESNKNYPNIPLQYKENVIIPAWDFNYNHNVALALNLCTSEWVCIINNDLIFHPGWFSEILFAYDYFQERVKSFGTWNENTHRHHFDGKDRFYSGYIVPKHISGWNIVARTEIFKQIGFDSPENQRVNFWYSDSVYADLLQKFGIKHTLCRNSLVTHLENGTIKTFPAKTRALWMKGQWNNYLNKPA